MGKHGIRKAAHIPYGMQTAGATHMQVHYSTWSKNMTAREKILQTLEEYGYAPHSTLEDNQYCANRGG